MTLTAAIESLHKTYPGEYTTSVETSCDELFWNNPLVVPKQNDDRIIEMTYPLIDVCNQRSISFLSAFTSYLSYVINRPLHLKVNKPVLYLSKGDENVPPYSNNYWVMSPGLKSDYTSKGWPIEYYQDIVDKTPGIRWVQIGRGDNHPCLRGVECLVNKTNTRDLIRLVAWSRGGLGPVTWLQHLCAAWERPYVCLLGGMEPTTWVQYPLQHTLHTMGTLPCCMFKACWKLSLNKCEKPVHNYERPTPKCMEMIKPSEVLNTIHRIAG